MKCFTISDHITKEITINKGPFLRIGAEGFCSDVPLSHELTKSFEALQAIGEESLAMEEADISRNPPLIITPQRKRLNRRGKPIKSDIALVHVATTSPGQLWFEANCYDEEVIQTKWGKRVRRAYKPFPGNGVDVLAWGHGMNGEPNALVRMLPGSSFRICRDTIDIPWEYTVVWPGTKLRLIVPERVRKQLRRGEAGGLKG